MPAACTLTAQRGDAYFAKLYTVQCAYWYSDKMQLLSLACAAEHFAGRECSLFNQNRRKIIVSYCLPSVMIRIISVETKQYTGLVRGL